MPVARALLLNVTHLHLDGVVEAFVDEVSKWWTFVHRFLAACPNLETLRSVHSFEYPLKILDSQNNHKDLPIVTLPKTRYLSTEGLVLDISMALGTLRLPALSTFDITAQAGMDPNLNDCDFYVIRRNVSEAPPPRPPLVLSLTDGRRARERPVPAGRSRRHPRRRVQVRLAHRAYRP